MITATTGEKTHSACPLASDDAAVFVDDLCDDDAFVDSNAFLSPICVAFNLTKAVNLTSQISFRNPISC